MGDCLEAQDTHGLWAFARVVACVDDVVCGPLVLFHFEGWSASWLMWLSRTHDVDRVRPLGSARGTQAVGSRGEHTPDTLNAIVREATARLLAGTPWPATGGSSYRTYPFRAQGADARSFQLQPRGRLEALLRVQQGHAGQAMLDRPFLRLSQLLANEYRQQCQEVVRRFRR